MPDPKPTMGLVTKLATIMGELGNVKKEGFNKAQGYRFVRESDVVAALVPLLAKHHVFLHQTVTSHDRSPLYTTQSGMTMWMTTVTVDGTWIDGDTGETLPAATFVGTGADTGDKGVYKAMTGSEKYMLMKTFLISTGDDPESDEKVDKAVAATGAASGPRVTKADHGKVGRGGKTESATDAQLAEVKRLARELGVTNSEEMQALIRRVLTGAGAEVEEWPTVEAFGDYLKGMTSVALGGLIVALNALVDAQQAGPEEDADGLDLA